MSRQVSTPRGAKLKADTLFSRIIRTRDGSCRNCGSRGPLQCAHLISRRFNGGRTNERNAVTLCAKCHHYFTDNPVAFGVWVSSWMGEAEYEELALEVNRVTRIDWFDEADRLKARLAELVNQ